MFNIRRPLVGVDDRRLFLQGARIRPLNLQNQTCYNLIIKMLILRILRHSKKQ